MMIKNRFKSGAASFYIVAFSTLILVIIAASFASAIIAEVTRTSNADLAQSAYDAALAGIEDAKAAFINYQNCLAAGGESAKPKRPDGDGMVTCSEIVYWMEHARDREDVYDADDTVNGKKINDCDMVGHILGRIPDYETGEVQVVETGDDIATTNNMQQAYTCVTVKTTDDKYMAGVNSLSPYRVVKIRLAKGISASDIGSVRVMWHPNDEKNETEFTYNIDSNKVAFKKMDGDNPVVPPAIAVQMIQTAESFSLDDLNGKTIDGKTDRGTVYLVPTDSEDMAKSNRGDIKSDWTYIGTYVEVGDKNGNNKTIADNIITSEQFASTNDHSKDYPFMVRCGASELNADFACSVLIELPEPKGGSRSDETFTFVVSSPYGIPTTFALQMICKTDGDGNLLNQNCGDGQKVDAAGNPVGDPVAMLDKMQVTIDSTGRANDLFRRIEVRLDPDESTFGFPLYAVMVKNDFEKELTVTKETQDYSGYSNW